VLVLTLAWALPAAPLAAEAQAESTGLGYYEATVLYPRGAVHTKHSYKGCVTSATWRADKVIQ
jgi:hypothetical protein